MKRIFALLSLALLCVSCSLDDNNYPEYTLELIPTDSVQIPEFFVQGNIYNIKMFYDRRYTCHFPNGIYYATEPNNTRVVAVQNVVYNWEDCTTDIDEEDLVQEIDFDFQVIQPEGTVYTFKFYQGKNQENQDTFIVVEVPVKPEVSIP
ncbi:MAG: hypothetical protein AB7D46_06100 [Flavobacteriaceae bacterium]